jgi:hypothetical protein
MRKSFVITFASVGMAHSIRIDVSIQSPAITVYAGYTKTKPIANAKVEVFAPESKTPFQLGKTDINGNFAFLPKIHGEWLITIDDEMGHKGKANVTVPQEFFNNQKADNQENAIIKEETKEVEKEIITESSHAHEIEIPTIYKAIFGLALIFGITGVLYGLNAYKKNKK